MPPAPNKWQNARHCMHVNKKTARGSQKDNAPPGLIIGSTRRPSIVRGCQMIHAAGSGQGDSMPTYFEHVVIGREASLVNLPGTAFQGPSTKEPNISKSGKLMPGYRVSIPRPTAACRQLPRLDPHESMHSSRNISHPAHSNSHNTHHSMSFFRMHILE